MLSKGKENVDDDVKRKGKRKLDEDETGPKRENRGVLQFTDDSAYQVVEDEDDYYSSSDDSMFDCDDLEGEVREELNVANIPAMAKEEEIDEEASELVIPVPLSYDEVIWKVKCLVGCERASAFCLMQRHAELKRMGTKLPIVSACAIDHVKGYIFIEARKLNDIDESCEGICSVDSTSSVPISISKLYRLALARSKSGGISQVAVMNHARNEVTVELAPRIDSKEMSAKIRKTLCCHVRYTKSGAIPPQRMIRCRERELEFMTNPNMELSRLTKAQALEFGQKLQETVQCGYPSFVKSLAKSEVRNGFLLAIPKTFCDEHLPKSRVNVVLEDENGSVYDVSYITPRCYLSAGWKAFAVDHKLDVDDALLFQLTQPRRFKVYMAKVDNNVHSEPIASDDAEPREPVLEHLNLDENYNNQVAEDDTTLEKSVDLEKQPQVEEVTKMPLGKTRVGSEVNVLKRTRRTMKSQDNILDSKTFDAYFRFIWSSFPKEKLKSMAYFDPLWVYMYANQSKRDLDLRWITKMEICSKKYVFVPIVMWSHWSLLIFCHLGESPCSEISSPCMLLLDSLQSPNTLEPLARRLLRDIYKVLERPEDEKQLKSIPFLTPKIPQQRNSTDCGFYVLHYMNLFLESAPENFSVLHGYPYFMKKDWFNSEAMESFSRKLNGVLCHNNVTTDKT